MIKNDTPGKKPRVHFTATAALVGAAVGGGLLWTVGQGGDATVSAAPGPDLALSSPATLPAGTDPGASRADASESSASEASVDDVVDIGAAEAGRIAAGHVGGTVDEVSPENDHGAAWDVDVYAPDGEYTIYVSSAGDIVRVEGPFTD